MSWWGGNRRLRHAVGRRCTTAGGFSLVEVLIAAAVLVLAAMLGVMHVLRTNAHLDWAEDQGFAREKAVSILDELRAFVEGGDGEVAADLDGFDDGVSQSPVLTISYDPDRPGQLVPPDHPTSGNNRHQENWRFWRRITVRPYGSVNSRDLRFVTVRVFRLLPGQAEPGDQLAEASSIVRTVGDAYPTSQVYDVYLLALENVPGWWVSMDAMQPFVEAVLADLQQRNRGLSFRLHWITKLGYGRDDEYAPYTNEVRSSTDRTPWTYVYPGRMPDGETAYRYYVPGRMNARVNLDGEDTPVHVNDYAAAEPLNDANGNGRYDAGEVFVDTDGSGSWGAGNPVPYALADMHNHCMRWPAAEERFAQRVAVGLDDEDTPTWRLLLDRMIADPDRYRNAILINLHGELLPMPPARNVSDAAKDPENVPGWRVVTHPELLRPRRVADATGAAQAPRFRVYAYKASFESSEAITSQEEPFTDANGNGTFDDGEAYVDWNGNGAWDAGRPISIVVRDGDFSAAPNAATAPSIRVLCLSGGVDANGDGTPEAYRDWRTPPHYPEDFVDADGDGVRQVAEPWLDLNGDGVYQDGEPWTDLDGDGAFTATTEPLEDQNANGVFDAARPAETFTDANGNGTWDGAEPWWDRDGDGAWTPPTAPVTPWKAWDPATYGNALATDAYVAAYGEPFLDRDGDRVHDDAETYVDGNANGVRDGGFTRGEMWFSIEAGADGGTVLRLHGTPLETPYESTTRRGLPASARLYDLDYIPCPTPASATGADRFERDLFTTDSSVPRNTARWIVELPLDAVRDAFETGPGALDGDAKDHVVAVETRLGWDLDTGVLWPTRREPQNLSVTYAYFYANATDLPYSERYQFQGDPRHSPYADTDARGGTAANGYNWYFDDFTASSGNAQGSWLAFDATRLHDGWLARGGGHDVPRLLTWLRRAVVESSAVYTTLTGFSYYYLSLGGDVGSDSSNGFANSIPMDGLPFGLTGDVHENTITDGGGDTTIRGSLKYVCSTSGSASGIRDGGSWWSKPWLGELFQDSAYASQWKPWGNLRAGSTTGVGLYKLIRRGDVTTVQQPRGTELADRYARLSSEGCTSVFNIGTASSTFHHQHADGRTGKLVDQGPQLAANYNFTIPDVTAISRPFGLTTNGAGGVGPEFTFTGDYPRYQAQLLARFYDHQTGQTGSGLVRLTEPSNPTTSGFIVVNGIDRTLETGSAQIARYSVASLLHSFFVAGDPGTTNRIHQLPRVEILYPTLVSEIVNPVQLEIRWQTDWSRWDGRPYTESYPANFAEDEKEVVYVLLYSRDGGRTWLNVLDESPGEPGVLPWVEGVGPDARRTLTDQNPGAEERWVWPVAPDAFPEGSYLLRVEAYRASERLHYAHHMEKVYVDR